MTVVLALARAGLHRRRGLAGLVLIVAAGLGVSAASFEAARRTERAYPDYLRQARVGDVVLNPSLVTAQVPEILDSTPGLLSHSHHSMLTATPDDGAPRDQFEVDSTPILLFVTDGVRYIARDRPVVHEGRMIRSGREAFLSRESAEALALGVGDTLPLAFWAPSFVVPGIENPTGVIEPIGRSSATVVGIGVFADEVLADELYPRIRVLVTPEVAGAFDCLPASPPAGDTRTLAELVPVLSPEGCATTYRHYSLQVDGGEAAARSLIDGLAARLSEENLALPASLREADIGYFVIPTFTGEDREAVHRSLQPAVLALQVFGAGAAMATLVVGLLVALRSARRAREESLTWLRLGAARLQRVAGVALPLLLAGIMGVAGSLLIGWAGSGIGPVASARALQPVSRLGLSLPVALVVVGGSAVILLAGVVLVAYAATRSKPVPTDARTSWSARAFSRLPSPTMVAGLRAASSGAGAKASLAASVAALAAVTAVSVFTVSLNGFVTNPVRFGWPYDLAVMIGYGYGGADPEAIATTLDRPEVARWGLSHTAVDASLDGRPVVFAASRTGPDDLWAPVVAGRLPTADGELALGAVTASELGLGVGDGALLTTPYGDRDVRVTGLVVLPTIGPFEADRVSLGGGALLSEPLLTGILETAEREGGFEPGALLGFAGSFVSIDLADGVEPEAFLEQISADLRSWDFNGFEPFLYTEPVRPGPVADVASMRSVPIALAATFALAMMAGLGLSIAATTRARRRELLVLRALGCLGRQLRGSVRWHAVAVTGVGLAVGVPLGIAVGRTSYRAFAEGLGFFPEPIVSPGWTALLALGAVGMGLLASAGPAWRAARLTGSRLPTD